MGTGTGTFILSADGGTPDAGAAAPVIVHLTVFPPGSEVSIGGAIYKRLPNDAEDVSVPPGGVDVSVRNGACCEEESRRLQPGDAGKTVNVSLGFLPAQVTPTCKDPDVQVRVDEKTARLGSPVTIPMGDSTQGSKTVTVEFAGKTMDIQKVTVKYAQSMEVPCKLE
jgi:hypothetical protein